VGPAAQLILLYAHDTVYFNKVYMTINIQAHVYIHNIKREQSIYINKYSVIYLFTQQNYHDLNTISTQSYRSYLTYKSEVRTVTLRRGTNDNSG
jgi:hypothetical protein